MGFDIYRVSKADSVLLRDWHQFSVYAYSIDWITPEEYLLDEFETFMDDRDYITPLNEFMEEMEDSHLPLGQDLVTLRNLLNK